MTSRVSIHPGERTTRLGGAGDMDALRRVRGLVGAGRLIEAERLCDSLASKRPDAPDVLVTLADIRLRRGAGDEAFECARKAAGAGADAFDVLCVFAPAAIAVGAQEQAGECLARFQQLPGEQRAPVLIYWAERLEDLFLFAQAASMLRPLAESGAADYAILVDYAQLLLKSHQARAADGVLTRAEKLAPDRNEARLARLRQSIQLGRLDEAAEIGIAILEREPGSVAAAGMLSEIAPERMPDDAVRLLERSLAAERTAPDHRATAGMALGRRLEVDERDDEAFAAFSAANRALKELARRNGRDYEPERVERQVAWLMRAFPDRMECGKDSGTGLIFIVGMPRSGTTLLDRVLAAHRQVASVGENTAMPDIASRLGMFEADPARFAKHLEHAAEESGSRYLSTLPYRPSLRQQVVDKLPLNFWNVGIIATLFPAARIVHAVRDPRDVGLSTFRLRFPVSFDFTNDLEDFAHYYGQQARLMEHWKRILPDSIDTVEYEHVVADMEGAVRPLLSQCGLDWDTACLSFSSGNEAVYTLSMGQVRQGLYTHAAGRWQRYASHLEPLETALRRWNVLVESLAHS